MRMVVKRIVKKENLEGLGIMAGLLLISFLLAMKSGYNIFSRGGTSPKDGDVFFYIGWLMRNKYVPYRDIFDHKGVFLYFLQYIGTFFGKFRGVWVIEVLFLTASVFVCYAIARKFSSRLTAIFVVLLTFARYNSCGYGNCIEEYSILFQLVAIYFFVDFYQKPSKYINGYDLTDTAGAGRKKSGLNLRVLISGVCFSCVFFMKANLCAVWIVFCIAIALTCIRGKYYRSLRNFIISFLAGSAVVAVPIICYLIRNGAVNDFIYDYFVFNGLYSSNPDRANLGTRVNSFVSLSNTSSYIAAFSVLFLRLKNRDKYFKLDVLYILYMLTLTALIAMSGQTYYKMEIAVLPAFCYPFSQLAARIDSDSWKKYQISALVIGFFAIMVLFPSWSSRIRNAANDISTYINKPEEQGYHEDAAVLYIRQHTDADDKIFVLGNQCRIYLYSQRLPASKYIYLADPRVDSALLEKCFSDLRAAPPRIIVDCVDNEYRPYVDSDLNRFLEEYHYELVLDTDKQVWQLN